MEQNITKSGVGFEVISPDTGLTSMQERCAILLASGIRLSDVAKELGTSRGTLYRWQNQMAFQCFYSLMKQDVKNYLEGSVLELHTQALEGIKSCLASENESVKLKASMWVVDKICQMQIGGTSIRQALKEESQKQISNNCWESDYCKALKDAGLRG